MHRILWTRTPEVNQPEVPGPQYRKSLAGDGTRRSSRGRSAKTVFYSGVSSPKVRGEVVTASHASSRRLGPGPAGRLTDWLHGAHRRIVPRKAPAVPRELAALSRRTWWVYRKWLADVRIGLRSNIS